MRTDRFKPSSVLNLKKQREKLRVSEQDWLDFLATGTYSGVNLAIIHSRMHQHGDYSDHLENAGVFREAIKSAIDEDFSKSNFRSRRASLRRAYRNYVAHNLVEARVMWLRKIIRDYIKKHWDTGEVEEVTISTSDDNYFRLRYIENGDKYKILVQAPELEFDKSGMSPYILFIPKYRMAMIGNIVTTSQLICTKKSCERVDLDYYLERKMNSEKEEEAVWRKIRGTK